MAALSLTDASVECEVGEAAGFVQQQVGPMVAGGEQGAGEGGVFLGPEMDGGAVDAGLFGGGGEIDWPATRA